MENNLASEALGDREHLSIEYLPSLSLTLARGRGGGTLDLYSSPAPRVQKCGPALLQKRAKGNSKGKPVPPKGTIAEGFSNEARI